MSQTNTASKLSKLSSAGGSGGRRSGRGPIYSLTGAQTSPSASPRSHPRSKHARCRAHTTSSAQRPGDRVQRQRGQEYESEASLAASARNNGGVKRSSTGGRSGLVTSNGGGHPSDRRSLEAVRHSVNNNGSLSSVNSVKYYATPVSEPGSGLVHSLAKTGSSSGRYSSPVTGLAPPPGYTGGQAVARQRSLEGEQWRGVQGAAGDQASLARSISFMTRGQDMNGDTEAGTGGRRSVESTPQSGRRTGHQPGPLEAELTDPLRSGQPWPGHSRTSSVSSMGPPSHGAVDGFPTPMINRRPGKARAASESEDSAGAAQSPAKERPGRGQAGDRGPGHARPRTLIADLVDSGLSTLTEPDSHR